jgi:hypothetical protein
MLHETWKCWPRNILSAAADGARSFCGGQAGHLFSWPKFISLFVSQPATNTGGDHRPISRSSWLTFLGHRKDSSSALWRRFRPGVLFAWIIASGWLPVKLHAQETADQTSSNGVRVLPVPDPPFRGVIGRKAKGKTGFGDFPDALWEMDAHVGEILDAIDGLGIRDNTIVVFTSDDGPEATWPWQESSGPWRGYYFTHMEGSLRVPFIIRWPGRIPAGRVSNEIVHEVDTYTTLAKLGGAEVPKDRPIDGVDQTDFLLGRSDKSNREGFPVYVAERLEAVKWRNWKVVFYDEERDWWTLPLKLGVPKAFDLITDPKEEYPATGLRNSWNAEPAMKIVSAFEKSLKEHPPIAPGTPDPYVPPISGR